MISLIVSLAYAQPAAPVPSNTSMWVWFGPTIVSVLLALVLWAINSFRSEVKETSNEVKETNKMMKESIAAVTAKMDDAILEIRNNLNKKVDSDECDKEQLRCRTTLCDTICDKIETLRKEQEAMKRWQERFEEKMDTCLDKIYRAIDSHRHSATGEVIRSS